MQIDTKAAGIVIGTLLLGAVLGGVGVGALTRQRAREVEQLRQPLGFVGHMEQVIQPKDSAQRAAVRPLLEATARRNDTIIRGAHEQLRVEMDSLRSHLNPLLDEQQRQRLEREGRLPDPFPPRRDAPPARAGEMGGPPPREGAPPPRDGRPDDRPPPRDGPPPRGGPPPKGGGPPPDRGPPPGGG